MLKYSYLSLALLLSLSLSSCGQSSIPGMALRRGDDPELAKATAEAQRKWPYFVQAFTKRKPKQHFSIKLSFTDHGKYEHMWADVDSIDVEDIKATLSDTPEVIHNVHEGQHLTVHPADVEDWLYEDDEKLFGFFSGPAFGYERGIDPEHGKPKQ